MNFKKTLEEKRGESPTSFLRTLPKPLDKWQHTQFQHCKNRKYAVRISTALPEGEPCTRWGSGIPQPSTFHIPTFHTKGLA
jgi:hypothetical protein